MNRNSGNVSKTKKLISGVGNNSKHNRKTFQKLSDTSSISSNRNSSAHSEEDVRVEKIASYEEQEQVTKKLQAKVKELRHKLRILEESVDSKDYSLGTIAREKDRAIGEIRRLERSNKLLRQQLSDERNHYLEEKEKFCKEMTKYKKKLQEVKSDPEGKKTPSSGKQPLINQSLRWQLSKEKGDFAEVKTSAYLKNSKSQKMSGVKDNKSTHLSSFSLTDSQLKNPKSIDSFHLYEGDDISLQMAALRTENAKLRSIICERDERNYELCLRFLRMKHYKNDIKDRFQDLENEYLQVITNLMDKIDEARQEFNFIIDQKFKRPMHSTNAMYLQMVQKNSRMAFENASLRLENQCLKKELNKYMNSSTECDRKTDSTPVVEDLNREQTMEENKSDTKLKRIKKNVNFKEIRTIYERYLTFKNSDTDSNYMSKTSTTVPSNGSLADPKSNESIIATEQNNPIVIQPTLPANALPDEILQKIFKRIDTSSCQTLDAGISKEKNRADGKVEKIRVPEGTVPAVTDIKVKCLEKSEAKMSVEEVNKVTKEPIIIDYKSPTKVTDSSSPYESKESIRIQVKENAESGHYTPRVFDQRTEIPKKENYTTVRKQGKQEHSWAFKNRLRSRVGCDWSFDRDSEEGSSSLDFPLRRFTFSGKTRRGRQEKSSPLIHECEAPRTRRIPTSQLEDSCGLQAKLEFSDLELPVGSSISVVGNPIQTVVEPAREKKSETTVRREAVESDYEDSRGKIDSRQRVAILAPAIGSRSRSSNKINLQDELMDVTMRQLRFEEPYWRREKRLQSTQSRTSTKNYRSDKENSNFGKLLQNEMRETQASRQLFRQPRQLITSSEPGTSIKRKNEETDVKYQRKPEASKRFSHRLFSTSPEQLKNILTESQLGPCRMTPIIVGHATTEMTQPFKFGESNNEIFLQLVLPPSSPKQSAIFSENETMDKTKIQKEASTSQISPVPTTKFSNQTECTSDIRIPISSLPTSNSTMEMVDSAKFERNSIMMRTLSAPGLLESNWLDPYTVCEMRDCGTNT